jgi:ketosteroid isomerase-like protein
MGMDQDAAGVAEVLAANELFYDAFRSGDVAAMEALWSERDDISVYHPNWPGITGRQNVMASWHQVMVLSEPPAIFCSGPTVIRRGRVAIVFCTEDIEGHEMTASNVFVEEDGVWRMTGHHARPLHFSGQNISEDGGDDGAA